MSAAVREETPDLSTLSVAVLRQKAQDECRARNVRRSWTATASKAELVEFLESPRPDSPPAVAVIPAEAEPEQVDLKEQNAWLCEQLGKAEHMVEGLLEKAKRVKSQQPGQIVPASPDLIGLIAQQVGARNGHVTEARVREIAREYLMEEQEIRQLVRVEVASAFASALNTMQEG